MICVVKPLDVSVLGNTLLSKDVVLGETVLELPTRAELQKVVVISENLAPAHWVSLVIDDQLLILS